MVSQFIGTSGWVYPDWTGRFYPNNKIDKLNLYSMVLNTVEVNMSFSRMPTSSLISSWDSKTPTNFKFSFKVPRIITHYKKLIRVEPYFEQFLELLEPLRKKRKLAASYFSFHPITTLNQKSTTLQNFASSCPTLFNLLSSSGMSRG